MRRGNAVFIAGWLLLLGACTRTVIVTRPPPGPAPHPAPDRGLRGTRPPPNAPLGPEPPADPPPHPTTAVTLAIPPGHLPDPGQCRLWIPGLAPGRQPRPRSRPCAGIDAVAPAGSWIVYRPREDRRLVHVRVVDERRPGIVTRIRIFDTDTGELLREEEPQEEPRQNDRRRQERPRDQRPPENRPPVVQPENPRPPEPKPPEARPPEQRPPLPPPEIVRPVQPPPDNRPPPEPPPPPPPPSSAATLAIPPGHLPALGECRVWIPRLPPGVQPKPKSRSCDGIVSIAPAGSWIIDRPRAEPKLVYVRLVDERRAGVLILIRVFDIESRRLVREEHP